MRAGRARAADIVAEHRVTAGAEAGAAAGEAVAAAETIGSLGSPVVGAVAAPPVLAVQLRHVPIEQVHESTWNPRKHWPIGADLEASIRQHGILTPLLVRPVDAAGRPVSVEEGHGEVDHFELAAGHRRLRAALAAGLTRVPAQIRDMDDATFREVLIIENLQRADIHPLDEADAYAALRKADGAYTPEAIAARVGKHTSYVYRRLKLLELAPKCREAFLADELTAAHAERLARLTPGQQAQALEEVCFQRLFGEPQGKRSPASVRDLDEWIQRHVVIEPRVTEDLTHYQPDFAEALGQEPDVDKLVQLSRSYYVDRGIKALTSDKWREVKGKKDRCEHVERGVIVHGGDPRILDFCRKDGCAKHRPKYQSSQSSYKPSKAELAQQERWKQQDRQRREFARVRTKVNKAFADHAAALPEAKRGALCLAAAEQIVGKYGAGKEVRARIGAFTVANAPAALALYALEQFHDRGEIARFTKACGFDLAAFEREQRTAKKTRPAVTKTATTSTTKRVAPRAKAASRVRKGKGRK